MTIIKKHLNDNHLSFNGSGLSGDSALDFENNNQS
jgi:hypothetical protein